MNITFQSPGEMLFSAGPIHIYWYGAILAMAFVVGLTVILQAAKDQNIDQNSIMDLLFMLVICGIICARLYYVLFDWKYFSTHLNEIFFTWKGGLSIHGVIIGGFIFMMAYTAINKLSLLKYTDLLAPGLIIGQAVGRWGNFFNSEAYGSPTDLPVRVFIPGQGYCHPTFLYESMWNLVVFFILFFVLRKRFQDKHGVVTCSYFILYSLGRFFIEGLRLDNVYSVFGMHIAQAVSLAMLVAGIIGLVVIYFSHAKTNRNLGLS